MHFFFKYVFTIVNPFFRCICIWVSAFFFSIYNSVVVELDPEAKPMKNMRLKCQKPTRTRTLPFQSPESRLRFPVRVPWCQRIALNEMNWLTLVSRRVLLQLQLKF